MSDPHVVLLVGVVVAYEYIPRHIGTGLLWGWAGGWGLVIAAIAALIVV
ncbi:hypothetical protein ACFQ1L_40475 [Phytohabitans flavus]|uniref:Uncharacterized protein n=1 Tax=Phytohabitans flavus TaxID=1076124 RepID=A0A6F8XIQ8_9ACTN|nr:hypothetical protein [Phytohabitans flavus]BCB73695.1 hypothetical protein Pflav_001050 [Phytohabitans flavus]